MSIIIFFGVLLVLVLVHEWGHFITAKKTGMRVDEFGFGFPPKLFGIKKGETEYTFNALPIGGFVRIWGENYEDKPGSDENQDVSRAFSSRPRWAQALVLVAGVSMNIIFAWFLFTITFMVGVPTAVDEAVATQDAQLYVAGTIVDSPASVLPTGSTISSVSYQDEVIASPTPTEFSYLVSKASPDSVDILYSFKEVDTEISVAAVKGLDSENPENYIVGVSLTLVEIRKSSFFAAAQQGFTSTWKGLVGITVGLGSLISQSVTGEADFSQVAGPVGIVGMVGDAAAFGLTALLTFTAIISLNLAVINMLPFPALDGGRLLFVGVEALTQKKIPVVWVGRLNLIGFAMLMLLMIAVTYNDVLRLL